MKSIAERLMDIMGSPIIVAPGPVGYLTVNEFHEYWYLVKTNEAESWLDGWESKDHTTDEFGDEYEDEEGAQADARDSFVVWVEVVDPLLVPEVVADPKKWFGLCGIGGDIDRRIGDQSEGLENWDKQVTAASNSITSRLQEQER